MRKKLFDLFVVLGSIIVLVELLIKKRIIYDSIIYALNLWVNNLIPSLFPFFIISDILINYNIIYYIPKVIRVFLRELFNITDNMLVIFLLSMISGFPSNARNTRSLYDRNIISLEEANHILIFSHFANPIFILSTVACFFLHSRIVGIVILLSHYISNIILGILFKRSFKINNMFNYMDVTNDSFSHIFISSIKRACDTIITICGVVIVFMMLSTIVIDVFNFNSYVECIIKGLFEITIGIEALSKLNLDLCTKSIIASCFLGFGGLSVHVQVLSQLVDTKINYVYFFIGRMYQMILSGTITYLLWTILKY